MVCEQITIDNERQTFFQGEQHAEGEILDGDVDPFTNIAPSENMNHHYFLEDWHFYRRELEDNRVIRFNLYKPVLRSNYHQNMVTVPYGGENRLFILGGSRDLEGEEPIRD